MFPDTVQNERLTIFLTTKPTSRAAQKGTTLPNKASFLGAMKKNKLPHSDFEYRKLTDEETVPNLPRLVFQMQVQQSLHYIP